MTSSFTRRLAVAAACAALALPVLAQTTPAAPAGSSDAPTSQMQKRSDHRADRQAQRAQWKEKRTERQAKNPRTGAMIKIPAKTVAKFKPGSKLTDAVN